MACFQKGRIMKVRAGRLIRKTSEPFGGVCYVPHRDDFFALDADVFPLVDGLGVDWLDCPPKAVAAYQALARLGLCETREPETAEIAYCGPSFIGCFEEIPCVQRPLVVNCFCTAHCPLKCIYCHADDLMTPSHRQSETDEDLQNVAATASMIPALVAVVTGGDPLTRPDRARQLIRGLAASGKAIVLDTSGVGDVTTLIDTLCEFDVHVRVSLDSITEVNDRTRPRNPKYVRLPQANASRTGAERTIQLCLDEGLPVTVQSVVSKRNDSVDEWRLLRDHLVEIGVRHWVMHVAVEGGLARAIEDKRRKSKSTRGGILPRPEVHRDLARFVNESEAAGAPIDIRCTDTDNTPNSVLLIGSTGDLYTEGYAHKGKVRLFEAGGARPDMGRSIWPQLDRFGHARRYLNWNPWTREGSSLNEICYPIPLPASREDRVSAFVETEAKFRVVDRRTLEQSLESEGFERQRHIFQRDEYFDTNDRTLDSLDWVVRLRKVDDDLAIAMKGPRFFATSGAHSRIEIEVEAGHESVVRRQLADEDLRVTWFLEKRRTVYRKDDIELVLDEVPKIGHYMEIEGSLSEIDAVEDALQPGLGERVRQNYRELVVAHEVERGVAAEMVNGASFDLREA